ncbi:MAG: hypothetical protein WCB77_07065, partial [Pseudolabrys sp.]
FWGGPGDILRPGPLGNQSRYESYFKIAASNKLKFVHIGRTAFAVRSIFLKAHERLVQRILQKLDTPITKSSRCGHEEMRAS